MHVNLKWFSDTYYFFPISIYWARCLIDSYTMVEKSVPVLLLGIKQTLFTDMTDCFFFSNRACWIRENETNSAPKVELDIQHPIPNTHLWSNSLIFYSR